MSDLAAFGTGIGIGLIILLPVIYVMRQEIGERARSLFEDPYSEGARQRKSDAGGDSTSGDHRPQGLSLGGALFCISASALTLLWGILAGGLFFILSGAVLGIAVLLTFVASKAT